MAGGDVSIGNQNAALVGLNSMGAPAAPVSNICDTIFEHPIPAHTVPIAYFTDYRCVFCREIGPLLSKVSKSLNIDVTYHELPLLGPTSVQSARAALAARQQGAYDPFHTRLMGTPFLPNAAYLRQMAVEEGIDADRLLADMGRPEIDRQLSQSKALADLFGFYGTPALVVGRTAVLGNVSERKLRKLIDIESNDMTPLPCT